MVAHGAAPPPPPPRLDAAPTPGAASSAAEPDVCPVCQKDLSKYACPRCNLRYCSLPCYKDHNNRCTETFYRESAQRELSAIRASPEQRRRLLETLRRLHAEDEDENSSPLTTSGAAEEEEEEEDEDDQGEGGVLSRQTLEKLAAGAAEVELDALPPAEQKAFLEAVAAGELSHLIAPWDPWWLHVGPTSTLLTPQGTRRIEEVGSSEQADGAGTSSVPLPPAQALPPLRSLIATPPSPLLNVHLADILYSYCYTLRYFNGDWSSDPPEAAAAFLGLSQALAGSGRDAVLDKVPAMITDKLERLCSPTFHTKAGSAAYGLALADDTAVLLHLGRPAVLCALADAGRMIQASEEVAKSGESLNRGAKKQLRHAERKLHFCMAWVNEQPLEVFAGTAALVEADVKRHKLLRANMEASKVLPEDVTRKQDASSLHKGASPLRNLIEDIGEC